MKRFLIISAAVVLALMSVYTPARATSTIVVRPADLVPDSSPTGWYFWNDADDLPTGSPGQLVAGPATPPMGIGSVELGPLTTASGATGSAVIATNAYSGTKLVDISSLGYSSSQPGPTLAIALLFDVKYRTSDSAYGGRLVFEPYQNGMVVVGSGWQTWSPLAGKWWATKTTVAGTGGTQVVPLPAGNCAISTPCAWSDILAAFPDAQIKGRLLLKAGSNWTGFDGYADALTVGVSGNDTTYDFDVPTPCTMTCYVRPDGNDLNGGAANTPGEAKKTIQAGVNAVSTGGFVFIAAGTYTEQVDIPRDMTLSGAGVATRIQSPAVLATSFTTSAANKAIVHAHGGTAIHIKSVQIDGLGLANANYRMEGVAFHNAGGSVASSTILGIAETPLSGNQQGVAVYALNDDSIPRSLFVGGNTISGYQKNGMALSGAGLTATVSGNTVTGAGPTALIAQNGIQLSYGAVGSITGNNVSGNDCTSVPGGCTDDPTSTTTADGAAGILVYLPGASTITVSGNTLANNQFGVWTVGATDISVTNNGISGTGGNGITVYDCDQWCSSGDAKGTTGSITGNTISGQTYGIIQRDMTAGAPTPSVVAHTNSITGSATAGAWSNVPFDAINNWWGSANGPANAANTFNVGAQGDAVSANIAFVPWLDAAPPSGVSFAPVTTTSPVGQFSSIQAGINGSNAGGTVNAVAGTFTENVTVSQEVTVAGAGVSTIVIPAVSGPNPPSCGSLCAGASSVILVKANNVTLHDLAVDGDNPTLTSGIIAGGADLDARNGIITDHTSGVYTNLSVHDVTVENIYLRGVYASSGGTFNFTDNTVQNVQADPASVAMFNFGGSGVFQGNNVSDAGDAISSNWSTGVQFLNNVVTNSLSGVHTDNSSGGDLIQGNTVTNSPVGGYGIWAFVPYVAPTFKDNTITNVDYAMAAFGSANPVTVIFQDNEVDGAGKANSIGALISTDTFGYGSMNSSASLVGNNIRNFTVGVQADSQTGFTASIDAQRNGISGNGAGVDKTTGGGAGTYSITMTPNWWGSDTGPNHTLNPLGTGNSVVDGVVYSPWVGFADASGSAGFQMASPMTWVAGPAVCGATCIQAAIDDASNGDTVKAKTGVYNEHVNVNKQITLTAGSMPIIDGGGSGDGITISVPNVTVSSFEVRNVANGIVIASGANNATVSLNNIHDFTSAAVQGTSATGTDINTNTVNGGHIAPLSCAGGFWGIQVQDVSGSIASNVISGIGNGLTSGCQKGRAIEADGTGTVAITGNNVTQYQKSGIIVRDTVASTITGNTTTGEGPSGIIAMNGITITSTAATTITGNHVGFNRYTPESDFSCGILYYPVGNPAANTLTISGNDSTEDEVGICLTSGTATAVSGADVQNNTITKHHQQGILVDTQTNALVDGNQIDGQGGGTTATGGSSPDTDTRYYGIFAVDSTGTISNNTIKGITHGPANGTQSGVGIRLTARSGNAANMTISLNDISDIQKNAMVITDQYGGSVNALIVANTVAGNGPINYIAQNGIQVSYGATATVTNNDVSGYDYTPNTAAAIGVLIYSAGTTVVNGNVIHDNMEGMYVQSTDGATISNNQFSNTRDTAIFAYLSNNGTYNGNQLIGGAGSIGMYLYDATQNNGVTGNVISGNDYGVYVDYSGPGQPTGNHFNQNCIAGNTVHGMATAGTVVPPVDATQNWWGKTSGANPPGLGDSIDPPATIDASSFLTTATAGCVTTTDDDGDGMPNAYENSHPCLNANVNDGAVDADSDLLTNLQEFNLGTDPCNPDTDGDACGDGHEPLLFPAINPLDPWDFYSVPVPSLLAALNPLTVFKENHVTAGDSQAVFAYFKAGAHTGVLAYEQDLNANGVKDGIEYDRSVIGPAHSGAPDGSISATDAQLSFAQFKLGYNC